MGEMIHHLRPSDRIEDIVGHMRESGAVIIDDFLDADLLARFNTEIDGIFENVPDGQELTNPAYTVFFGPNTRHLSGVAGYSRVFAAEVLTHPLYQQVCDEVLLPFCVNYRLNVAHILDRGPGSEQQYPHRDEDVWAHLPKPHPEIQVASIIALEDFTTENGATRIAPGSNHWDRERTADFPDLVPAEMKAGSAVLYLGSTIHGGGPNTSKDQRRRGMHLSFNVGWLRTEENNFLVNPIDSVRDLPERAQELLGYRVHDAIEIAGGSLGLYHTNDPLELMKQGKL